MAGFNEKTPGSFTIWTDGACIDLRYGGWAFLIHDDRDGEMISSSDGVDHTTNNRMELAAVIEGLSAIPEGSSAKILSDSKYVVQGINLWMKKWEKSGWKRKATKKDSGELKNKDLWKRISELCKKRSVIACWVKGHNGDQGNEWCDQKATERASEVLQADQMSRIGKLPEIDPLMAATVRNRKRSEGVSYDFVVGGVRVQMIFPRELRPVEVDGFEQLLQTGIGDLLKSPSQDDRL
ncbi:ribonuclease HI [bacterium]|nr:ribonuclease HI [bacterium]